MRFGCCSNMVAKVPGSVGEEVVDAVAELGYDYIELPLSAVMALSDSEYQALKAHLKRKGITCESCNDFVPPEIRITGKTADEKKLHEYMCAALARAEDMGVKTVVFGSGGAKTVPANFSRTRAYEQVVAATIDAGQIAAQHGITIALEPIRLPDCNIINYFYDGVRLAQKSGQKSVRVLADYYHMCCLYDTPDTLDEFGKEYLAHIHFSFPHFPIVDGKPSIEEAVKYNEVQLDKMNQGRTYPAADDGWDYSAFVEAVKRTGYDGRVSIEARSRDFRRDAEKTLRFLKELF